MTKEMLGAREVLLKEVGWIKVAPKYWDDQPVTSYETYPVNTDEPTRFKFVEADSGLVISGPITSVLATKNKD